ncbi:MAG: peptidoglycan editing factor PgeF [Amphiplicatus sp.]
MRHPPLLQSSVLSQAGASHGFFGRAGGVSKGVFASLNAGLGSADNPEHAAMNRARCAITLGVEPDRLLTLRQVHSSKTVLVRDCWVAQGPEADAMVTRMRGVALGVLAADCMPFLFIDAEAGVIGAAHAGWRGALAGVLEATVDLMRAEGAEPNRIAAALGPCLRQENFEVGLDLADEFLAKHPASERFFAPGATPEKRQFDLAGFGCWRLTECGIHQLDDLGVCTLAQPDDYFSYRAGRRIGATDYGRNLSAIALPASGA